MPPRRLQAERLFAKYVRAVGYRRSPGLAATARPPGSARVGPRCGQPWWSAGHRPFRLCASDSECALGSLCRGTCVARCRNYGARRTIGLGIRPIHGKLLTSPAGYRQVALTTLAYRAANCIANCTWSCPACGPRFPSPASSRTSRISHP